MSSKHWISFINVVLWDKKENTGPISYQRIFALTSNPRLDQDRCINLNFCCFLQLKHPCSSNSTAIWLDIFLIFPMDSPMRSSLSSWASRSWFCWSIIPLPEICSLQGEMLTQSYNFLKRRLSIIRVGVCPFVRPSVMYRSDR